MRFYHIAPTNKGRAIKFVKSIKSPAQARDYNRRGWVVASVTTILQLVPNDFLAERALKQIYWACRKHPNISFDEAKKHIYGFRKLPDGRTVTSSAFGTAGHKELEKALERYLETGEAKWPERWDPWIGPVINWILENYEPIHMEYKVADPIKYKTCGTVDLVVQNRKTERTELLDFKFRYGGDDIKQKFYPGKDAPQLAVEADMIKDQWGLEYVPRTTNIAIDTEPTGNFHPKQWTYKAQAKALSDFEATSKFYNYMYPLNTDRSPQ